MLRIPLRPRQRAPRDAGRAVPTSWLVRDGMDRERMLDMDARLRPVRTQAVAILAVALVASGPWLGWWTLVPLAVAVVLFRVTDLLVARSLRPEYPMFLAWLISETIIAVSVALTGVETATLSWLAIPIVTLASRFSDRGIVVGVLSVFALLVGVCFGTDAHGLLANPTFVIAPAALVAAVTILSMALMRSEVEHRNQAVLDDLTGMLNRAALRSRVAELEQQSARTAEPVGIVVADVDRFKRVNDEHGHARGDAVLQDVANVIRRNLRAFDLAYRIGGEEFLVLLPGACSDHAAVVAEQLRSAVESAPVADGLRVTISCGVAASAGGTAFDYGSVFVAADQALYRAKRSGRNRVCEPPSAAARALALA